MTTLTYVGGPYAGQKRSSVLLSGREVFAQGAVTAGIAGGFSRGIYKRQGDTMVWTPLSGDWKTRTPRKKNPR